MSNSDPRSRCERSGQNPVYGAVSLFSTVLSNALEQQKNNIIQHFESRFANEKSEKATGVDATDFTFKSEQEKETLRRRNKIQKIADKHGWDTVQEYLDSPFADNKDEAVNLRSAITSSNSRRRNSKPNMIVRWKNQQMVMAVQTKMV
ncbi:Hypothetical predicted protein [Mytilus galloprovincialis]|uniref:Uncharacterized protein n=1 Tax=Mytilus galloprovincialis TaxID=29158 RepID=A0A8B6G4R3_MYTGA|nr:Hypothetical predicted protein [Mytilus galloprovincialis]